MVLKKKQLLLRCFDMLNEIGSTLHNIGNLSNSAIKGSVSSRATRWVVLTIQK